MDVARWDRQLPWKNPTNLKQRPSLLTYKVTHFQEIKPQSLREVFMMFLCAELKLGYLVMGSKNKILCALSLFMRELLKALSRIGDTPCALESKHPDIYLVSFGFQIRKWRSSLPCLLISQPACLPRKHTAWFEARDFPISNRPFAQTLSLWPLPRAGQMAKQILNRFQQLSLSTGTSALKNKCEKLRWLLPTALLYSQVCTKVPRGNQELVGGR